MNAPSPRRAPRVAIYRSTLLPLSETFIRDQAKSLVRWQPTLFGDTLLADRLAVDGVPMHTLGPDNRWGRLHLRADLAAERLVGHSLSRSRLLRALRPDLVHVHFATDAVILWPSVKRLGLPMLVTLHGYDINTRADWWRAGHSGRHMRSYPDRLIAMARHESVHFIAVSQAIRQSALDFGLPAERLSVKHIGVQTGLFAAEDAPPSQRRPEVLFVGRLVEKKGATYLLQAAAQLRERVPGLKLVILGDGPLRGELAAQALALGVNAEFLGAQPHSEVRRQLRTARVLCMPSITASNGDAEGLGMVLLEAQSTGVPVVTSARGGADEGMIDGLTGLAFDERNVDQLAAALETLMRDDARADAMALQAAAFVRERFDIAHCSQALEAHYDEVSAACSTGPSRRQSHTGTQSAAASGTAAPPPSTPGPA